MLSYQLRDVDISQIFCLQINLLFFQGVRNIIITQMRKKIKTNWTQEEKERAYSSFISLGCSWTRIAARVLTHSGAQIKNKIYSTLRRGFRKINAWIKVVKRRIHPQHFHRQKYFQPLVINKLMAVIDNNFQGKFNVKPEATQLCILSLLQLFQLGENDRQFKDYYSYQNYDDEERPFNNLRLFNKHCKKKRYMINENFLKDEDDQDLSLCHQVDQQGQNDEQPNQSSNKYKELITGKDLQVQISFIVDDVPEKASCLRETNHIPGNNLEDNFLENKSLNEINEEIQSESGYLKSDNQINVPFDSDINLQRSFNNVILNNFNDNSMMYECDSPSQPFYFMNGIRNQSSTYHYNLINNRNVEQKSAYDSPFKEQFFLHNLEGKTNKLRSIANDQIQEEIMIQEQKFPSPTNLIEKRQQKSYRYTAERSQIDENNELFHSMQL